MSSYIVNFFLGNQLDQVIIFHCLDFPKLKGVKYMKSSLERSGEVVKNKGDRYKPNGKKKVFRKSTRERKKCKI